MKCPVTRSDSSRGFENHPVDGTYHKHINCNKYTVYRAESVHHALGYNIGNTRCSERELKEFRMMQYSLNMQQIICLHFYMDLHFPLFFFFILHKSLLSFTPFSVSRYIIKSKASRGA